MCQVGLTLQEVQRDILLWNYHSILDDPPGRGFKRLGIKRVPTQFEGLREYCHIFRVLLLEELKAHLVQVRDSKTQVQIRSKVQSLNNSWKTWLKQLG